MADPVTRTKEEVLADYNAVNGTNLTFAQLGTQLAMKELQAFRRKRQREEILDDIVV